MDNRRKALTLLGLQLAVGAFGLAMSTAPAYATPEIDRRYALETIGALRSWDNVDGLFADYVSQAYKEYFARQSRFRQIDFAKADEALGKSRLPYIKAIEDVEILGQLSRSMKAQSILRTKVRKEGPQYRFTIDWLHSPGMDVLATESFTLTDPGRPEGINDDGSRQDGEFPGLGDIKGSMKLALDQLFKKVPFQGQVTGRDEASVTVNLGLSANVKKGDTLVVGTLDDVKKHPLLKSIVDWRITPTGRIEIEQVEEGIAFGRVVSEEEGRQVARFQKITQIIPKAEPSRASSSAEGAYVEGSASSEPSDLDEPPKLGFGMASLWTGGFSSQFSSVSGTSGKSGGGFLFGARGLGEIWFNREFFANVELGYGGFGYSQSDLVTGNPTPAQSVSGNAFLFKADAGYSYLVTGDFFGPKGFVKAGYLVTSYSLPINATESTAPFSVQSVFLGLGGDLPIRDRYGARVDLEFGLLNNGRETGESNGKISSSNNARIYMGGYYRYRNRITFQAGIEIQGTGAEFEKGSSLSRKTITFLPGVTYYF